MGISCKGYPDNKFKKVMSKLDYEMKKEVLQKKKAIVKKADAAKK